MTPAGTMGNQGTMGNPETVGDPDLEAEYLCSKILSGLLLPSSYTNLRVDLAGLVVVEAAPSLKGKMWALRKKTVDNFGLLKDSEMERYFKGDSPDVFSLIQQLRMEVFVLSGVYEAGVADHYQQTVDTMAEAGNTYDYEALGKAVDGAQPDIEYTQHLDSIQVQLRKLEGPLREIEAAYGVNEKIPKRPMTKPGDTPEYKIFLSQLANNIGEVASNVRLGFKLGSAMDALTSLAPKDDLDPYLKDVYENFLEVVTDPKSFYSKCSKDEIISPSVGQMYQHCYSAFALKYADMFVQEADDMPYQDVLDFRKSLGMEPDDGALTALCSQYVSLGFKPPPAPQEKK